MNSLMKKKWTPPTVVSTTPLQVGAVLLCSTGFFDCEVPYPGSGCGCVPGSDETGCNGGECGP